MLLSIPSPSRGELDVGPISIHAYGLMLLLAIVAATVLTGIRWTRRGGDWDLVFQVAVWGVAFGIIGARLYHVVTSWDEVPDEWWGVFAVWKGGLGVWGGIFLGVLAGAVVVKRAGQSVFRFMDAVAPGLLLAQAIGRWGNWFNQELYGKPTDLPWGLEIDIEHRPEDISQLQQDTFHPVFLYEFVWNLIGVGVLLLLDRRFRFRPPALFALYVAWYTAFRAYEETLRIDPSHEYFGMRLNFYVSVALFALSVVFFVWWQFFRRGREPRPVTRRLETGPRMAVPKGRVRG